MWAVFRDGGKSCTYYMPMGRFMGIGQKIELSFPTLKKPSKYSGFGAANFDFYK